MTTAKTKIQKDSMDEDLRNCLWNLLKIWYWDAIAEPDYAADISEDYYGISKDIQWFFKGLWINYFKSPLDTLTYYWPKLYKELRAYYFKADWNKVYDIIEFISKSHPNKEANRGFRNSCNDILTRELSAYRFVGNEIAEITSEEEIKAIEDALSIPSKFKPVKEHLQSALELYSDRKNPDYRNSIKESISAVESLGKLLTKNDKAMLPDALKELEKKQAIHPALKEAFIKLYGYTSDSNGIRHGLMDESNLDSADAKYMLVICSAFVNYLISKMEK